MDKKKRFANILMICILTAVTVLTSSITTTDVQAATPKAIKVQSFKRTGTKTATLKFKKPAKATKYQVRYSFYQDFRPGFTETSKSMKRSTRQHPRSTPQSPPLSPAPPSRSRSKTPGFRRLPTTTVKQSVVH